MNLALRRIKPLSACLLPTISIWHLVTLHSSYYLNIDVHYTIFQWQTLSGSLLCCGASSRKEWTEAEVDAQLSPKKAKKQAASQTEGSSSPDINIHPWDSTVNLSVHQPLYPPGRIVHVVRYYPKLFDDSSRSDFAHQLLMLFSFTHAIPFFLEVKLIPSTRPSGLTIKALTRFSSLRGWCKIICQTMYFQLWKK